MTDRYSTITVVLERDMRDDDAESLIAAICRLRGVLSASGKITDPDNFMAEERARHDLGQKLWTVLYPDYPKAKS